MSMMEAMQPPCKVPKTWQWASSTVMRKVAVGVGLRVADSKRIVLRWRSES